MTQRLLKSEDREHGFATLARISNWTTWIKRRTETIEFVGDAAVRRQVAVDFRLQPEYFGTPIVHWGSRGMHYVPLAFLEKLPLASFGLRDEAGQALPLITRRKNAAIAAAMLAALAQSILAKRLRAAGGPRQLAQVRAHQIVLPAALERLFYDLAALDYEDRAKRTRGVDPADAKAIFDDFWTQATLDTADMNAIAVASAPWVEVKGGVDDDIGERWTAELPLDVWKAALAPHEGFRELMHAVARTFLLCVPVTHSENDRRIIKYSYQEPIREPILAAWHKSKVRRRREFGRLREFEDKLEGLPLANDPFLEWSSVGESTPRETIKMRTKLLRALGWRAKTFVFQTPAVGWGGSYHLELAAPEGIQVRRAVLRASGSDNTRGQQRAIRGARNLERAHLYLGDVQFGRVGTAEVGLKPKSSTIVRTAAVTAFLVTGALALTLACLERIRDGDGVDVAGALLLIVPGVIAVYTARGGEHTMTTSLLYGLRLVAGSAGVWAVSGAGLILLGPATGARLFIWLLTIALAAATTIVLCVAWRLSARGRPLEQQLTETVGGA